MQQNNPNKFIQNRYLKTQRTHGCSTLIMDYINCNFTLSDKAVLVSRFCSFVRSSWMMLMMSQRGCSFGGGGGGGSSAELKMKQTTTMKQKKKKSERVNIFSSLGFALCYGLRLAKAKWASELETLFLTG